MKKKFLSNYIKGKLQNAYRDVKHHIGCSDWDLGGTKE